MKETRKEIAFYLDTKALQKYYPKDNWGKAYADIKEYMLKNDFSWRQGSVYVSNGLRTNPEIVDYLDELSINQPWLNLCMRDCTVTNVGKIHNQTYIFCKEKLMVEIEQMKTKKTQSKRIEKEEEEEI